MKQKSLDKPVNSIRQAISILEEAAASLEVPASVADKVKRVVKELGKTARSGLREAARRLDVDVSTICHWRRGRRPNKKNLAKIEALYRKLFGEG